MLIGAILGAVLLLADLPDFEWSDLRVVIFAAVVGLLVPALHNRYRRVGAWDPKEIEKNKRGRR